MRGYAIEVAYCTIYQWQISADKQLNLDMYDEKKLDESDIEYINKIVDYAIENNQAILEIVAKLANKFSLERIYKLDLAAMHLAIAEIQCTDTPPAVVISQIINIVKRYSTPKSVSFVNGVLGNFMRGNG